MRMKMRNQVTISQELLASCLGDAINEFDTSDPYQCFAFINLLDFVCSKCERKLDVSVVGSDLPSARWCKAAGSLAVREGWNLPEIEPDGTMHLTLLCPDCAKHKT